MPPKSFKPFLLCFPACLLLFLVLFLIAQRAHELAQQRDIRYLALVKSKEISDALLALLLRTETLAALVMQGNGRIRDFDSIAPVMLNRSAIRNMLLAPGGVVSDVYPREGNEKLIGFNLFGPGAGSREALRAKDTGSLTLGGPFEDRQGNQILAGRLPVYLNHNGERTFWGMVSVALNFPEALESVNLNELEKQEYACEIWRINPDTGQRQVILSSGAPLHHPVEKKLSLLNADWFISIAPSRAWYASPFFCVCCCGALLGSLLLGASAQNYYTMKRLKCSMEEMAMKDSLTGLPNRRAAFETLWERAKACRERGESLALGYLDLNHLKEINDSCGHQVGDVLLQEAARRLREVAGRDSFVARIGGDEFIVILPHALATPSEVKQVFRKIKDAMRREFSFENFRLNLSISAGFALYPQETDDIEKLANLADQAMYEDKQREHQARNRNMSTPPRDAL